MHHKLISTLTIFVGMTIASFPATAQTPDGSTPAQEAVRDPLMADDITEGHYGL